MFTKPFNNQFDLIIQSKSYISDHKIYICEVGTIGAYNI